MRARQAFYPVTDILSSGVGCPESPGPLSASWVPCLNNQPLLNAYDVPLLLMLKGNQWKWGQNLGLSSVYVIGQTAFCPFFLIAFVTSWALRNDSWKPGWQQWTVVESVFEDMGRNKQGISWEGFQLLESSEEVSVRIYELSPWSFPMLQTSNERTEEGLSSIKR